MPVRKRLLPEPSPKKVPQSPSEPSSKKSKPEEATVEPRLLTIPQVAKYLNTSVWSVREMLRTKRLRRVAITGKKIVIDRADVDAFIEKLKAA